MTLEVITRRPQGKARPTPIVFVHGAYGAAWIWDQHFLPYFAERGWVAHAVSLRGHGGSSGAEMLRFARLRDYVADLEQVALSLDRPPVLVGHSMGGMVVQKYLHEHACPAAVLMASVPPHGVVGSLFGMALTNPALLFELSMAQAKGPTSADADVVRRALFSDDTPAEVVAMYLSRFQDESTLVLADLMGLDLPPSSPQLDLPVLVLGAENDEFVFRAALDATARTYRTQPEVFPGMAHAMMLDHDWARVADRICGWVEATLGERAPAPSPAPAPAPADRPAAEPRRLRAAVADPVQTPES